MRHPNQVTTIFASHCKVVGSIDEIRELQPGVTIQTPGLIYRISKSCIVMNCPCCGDESAMDVYESDQPKSPSPSWLIENFSEAVTLSPSINCVGCCGWHGYLKHGEFKLA